MAKMKLTDKRDEYEFVDNVNAFLQKNFIHFLSNFAIDTEESDEEALKQTAEEMKIIIDTDYVE